MSHKNAKTKLSICAICQGRVGFRVLYRKNFSADKHLTVDVFSARRLPDKIHGSIVKCNQCGLVRSLEIIDQDRLSKLYKNSNFTYSSLTNNLKDSYRQALVKAMRYTSSKTSFLEIGCGNGFTMEVASELGFKRVYGVEPSTDAIAHAHQTMRKNIINTTLKWGTFLGSKFDLICAFQVFDHIPDPNDFLQICHHILKPRGILLLFNHNAESLSTKILGENSPIFDIEHTFLYSQTTIAQILNNNKFIVKKVYSPPAIMSIRYIIKLLPLPKKVKAYLSNLKFPLLDYSIKLYPGNLCAIAIKK